MRQYFVTQKLIKLVPKVGGELIIELQYGYCGCIIFDNGKRTFYKESCLDINTQGAVRIAIDKGYSNYFLQHFGFLVPAFDTFVNEELNRHLKIEKGIQEGYLYALELGFPVIIKPNAGAKGKHIYKINNKEAYFESAKKLFVDSKIMMVQQFAKGNDFRIVVFDGKVYCAYQRLPLQVIGNGEADVRTLLKQRSNELKGITTFSINDQRIRAKLAELNLSYNDILPKGVKVMLLNIANLSLGGKAIDFTDKISAEYKALAIGITQKMGLRLCGIDLMTDSITGKVNDYSIIEINSAPGYSNFALLGEPQSKIIDGLYLDMLRSIKNY